MHKHNFAGKFILVVLPVKIRLVLLLESPWMMVVTASEMASVPAKIERINDEPFSVLPMTFKDVFMNN